MSNAKRAIMVPVMTLAVCAIAMVGLGFALETNVTSNSDTVEKLMIDMTDEAGKGALESANAPTETPANNMLTIGIETDKASELTFQVSGGEAYIKIFGNVNVDTLTVTITDSNETSIANTVKLALYDNSENKIATTAGGSGTFTEENSKNIVCGTVYKVKIVGFCGFTYNDNGAKWSGTGSGFTGIHNLTFTFTATGGSIDPISAS